MNKTPKREKKATRQVKVAPLPWKVDDREGDDLIRVVSSVKPNGMREIICLFPMMTDNKLKRAHAELITAAVNAYGILK